MQKRKRDAKAKPRRSRSAEEHLARVTEAYLEKTRDGRSKNGRHPNSLANLLKSRRRRGEESGHEDADRAPRCQAIRSDGGRCRAPALAGATRCNRHGGRIENPAHPGNLRRLADGRLPQWAEGERAAREWKATPPEIQRAIIAHAAPSPHPATRALHHTNLLRGVQAYTAAQRGEPTAWQNWLAQQPNIAAQMQTIADRQPIAGVAAS